MITLGTIASLGSAPGPGVSCGEVEFMMEVLENDMVSRLSADRTTLNAGESVTITATVTGGQPPYYYRWFVDDEHRRSTDENTFTTQLETPGRHFIEIEVDDANFVTDVAGTSIFVQAD
jgi:hypothetical protein